MRLPHSTQRRAVLAAFISLAVPAAVLPALAAPAQAVSDGVVISRVYGGGGNSGAPLNADYVELFNRGTSNVSLGTLSIQYGSATGSGAIGGSGITELPDVTLEPGQYYLVQEASGTNGSALSDPDHVDPSPLNMSGSAGKVVLVTGDEALGCNGGSIACDAGQLSRIVDLVGWGSANFFEGTSAAPGTSNTTDVSRAGNGCQDTDQNSADFTAGAPAPRNTDTTRNPCGAVVDDPPTVATTSPAADATNVPGSSDVTVTFSEGVDAPAGAFSLTCADSGAHPVTVSGGPTTFTLDPAADFGFAESCTVTVTASQVSDQDGAPTAMAADYTFSFTTAGNVCTTEATPVYEIQGPGPVSPRVDDVVTVRATVVADTPGLSGFFVQDQTGDGDPATSDGVFVFVPSANPNSGVDVSVGDVVGLTGRVVEFNTLTEIDNVTSLSICGSVTPPAATTFNLPETTNDELERVEGMLVTVPQTLTVQQNFFQGRYGQVTLGSGGRLYQPTNQFPADSPEAQALADANARALLVLDDSSSRQNPDPVPYLGADGVLRAGDTVAGGLTGVIDYGPINSNSAIRDYRLHPTAEPTITNTNPRTAAPEAVGGNLTVASFNVLNYFTTFTGSNARGADNQEEFDRQRDKIFAAVAAIDADVVGLIEIENSANDEAIDDFVEGINAYLDPDRSGSPEYAKVPTPVTGVGDDAIRVAMIYKPARVSLSGASMSYDVDAFSNARVPMAQTFMMGDEKISVIVNHFKSKGSCPDADDPDAPGNVDSGDGQACWNADRVEQAEAIVEFVDDIQRVSGDRDVLVIGDLNAYAEEDPILTLEAAGITDQLERFQGKEAYSYVFDGMSGYLDHALATASLTAQITGVTEWHINADEPSIIDYNTEFKPDDRYEATPYRSSDHDPIIVGLQLDATAMFDNLEAMVNRYEAEGQITSFVAAGLRDRVQRARANYLEGSESRPIGYLEQFVARAENQIKGDADDLAARDALVRAAEAIIAELRDAEQDENAAIEEGL